jgi:hypothetical protein
VDHIVRENKSGRVRKLFHSAPHRLLRSVGHRISFVGENNFVVGCRESHVAPGRRFDILADDFDPTRMERVQFNYSFFTAVANKLSADAEQRYTLPNTRTAGQNQIWDVPLLGNDPEVLDNSTIATHIVENSWMVFLDLGNGGRRPCHGVTFLVNSLDLFDHA